MNKKTLLFLLLSMCSFIVVFMIALMVGKYNISIPDFFKAVFTNDEAYDTQRSILTN